MKRFLTFCFALILAFAVAVPASAGMKDMWAQVYSWDGTMNGDGSMALVEVTSGVTFQVLQRNSDTEETLTVYNDNAYTSLTNPVTTANFESATVCDDKVAFRVDPGEATDTYVDLIVVNTSGGYTTFVEDFSQYKHSIIIDERPGVSHIGAIWFAHSTTAEVDTGIDLDYDTLVNDARVEVVGTCNGCTIDVGLLSGGTAGDADGFRDGVLTTTAGFITDTGIITNHASADYTAVSTYGALLYTALTGTSAHAATTSNAGGRSFIGHVVTAANEQSITYTVDSTFSGDGYIFFEFMRLR